MSEEQPYYQPQANITQNAKGVWILNPVGHASVRRITATGYEPCETYSGLLIGPAVVGEGESLTSVTGVTAEMCAGREMVLAPKETLHHIHAAQARIVTILDWMERNAPAAVYATLDGALTELAKVRMSMNDEPDRFPTDRIE